MVPSGSRLGTCEVFATRREATAGFSTPLRSGRNDRVLVDVEGKVNKAECFARILFGLYGKYDGGENVSCLQ